MEKTFAMNGLSCNTCVRLSTEGLLGVPGITAAYVNLADGSAMVVSDREISVEEMNQGLAQKGKFRVAEWTARPRFFALKKFIPLANAFGLVLLFVLLRQIYFRETLGIHVGHMGKTGLHQAMLDFMAGFYLLFGGLKAYNWRKFASGFADYDVLASRSSTYALTYPAIELTLGLAYLAQWQLLTVNIVSLGIMSVGTIGITRALGYNRQVFENLLMAGMAAYMILA
jgi:cation transport ATPase